MKEYRVKYMFNIFESFKWEGKAVSAIKALEEANEEYRKVKGNTDFIQNEDHFISIRLKHDK